MGYTREFLICAFLFRFLELPADKFVAQHALAESFYDKVGKDTFRVYCSLDAAELKRYKESEFLK